MTMMTTPTIMTIFRKLTLLTLVATLSGCCIFRNPEDPFEAPNPNQQYSGEKMAEFISNKIYTSLITSDALLTDYDARVYYVAFKESSDFIKSLNVEIARKNRISFVKEFSSYVLRGDKITITDDKAHVKLSLLSKGKVIWNYDKEFMLNR